MLQARLSASMSQAQAAQAVGVAQSTVSKLERGEQLGTEEIVKFARAYGVDIAWLALGEGPGPAEASLAGDTLGARLASARALRSMTYAALGEAAGMTTQGVRAVEVGETKDIAARNAFSLADALGVSARWLVTGEGLPVERPHAASAAYDEPSSAVQRLARQLHALAPEKLTAVCTLLGLRTGATAPR